MSFCLQEWSFLGVECSPFLALADTEYCLYEHLNGKLLGSRFYWMFKTKTTHRPTLFVRNKGLLVSNFKFNLSTLKLHDMSL